MTDTWLVPDQIFDGQSLVADHALAIHDGRVADLLPAALAPPSAQRLGGIVSMGFIDLQVNGGGGILLNDLPTPKSMSAIAKAHRAFGTVGILPTVITDAPRVLAKAVEAALAAKGRDGILGLHIEGPHIAETRRGTHAAQYIRPLDDTTLDQVRKLRQHDVPVMITLAPESATLHQIAQLAAMGAVVSLGHTDATAAQTKAAIAAGARCATHLFNAMSPMLNRAPGVTGAVINSDVHAGLIVDGLHVDDDMIRLALRARPQQDLMFIVSDSMPTVGGPDHFDLYGARVRLENGRLLNVEGSLAGAHITQAQGVHRLAKAIGMAPDAALRCATTVPARVMSYADRTAIQGTRASDLIHLTPDLEFAGFVQI